MISPRNLIKGLGIKCSERYTYCYHHAARMSYKTGTICRHNYVREFHRSTVSLTLTPLGTMLPLSGAQIQLAAGRAHQGTLFPRDFLHHNRGFHQNGRSKNGNNTETSIIVSDLWFSPTGSCLQKRCTSYPFTRAGCLLIAYPLRAGCLLIAYPL